MNPAHSVINRRDVLPSESEELAQGRKDRVGIAFVERVDGARDLDEARCGKVVAMRSAMSRSSTVPPTTGRGSGRREVE